jgi:predicted O-methyltransferase YrrM
MRPFVAKRLSVIDNEQFGATSETDISDHLNFLHFVLNSISPMEILELGTRGGESTRVLEQYCRQQNIKGRSIDLAESPIWLTSSNHWHHYKGDDLILGQNILNTRLWPDGQKFDDLDFIFLDTSHLYQHTLDELRIFVPLLKDGGYIALHDTNLFSGPSRKISGKINVGWNNKRGVSRALEDFFDIEFQEKTFHSFTTHGKIRHLIHLPWSNGMTVIQIAK